MITNKLNLPQPFVDAATSNHSYKPHRYSVTEVLGGTCEAILKRRHGGEQDEDVSDRLWAILGTAVHKVLQDAESTESQLQENWIAVPVSDQEPKYYLSGIFDLYDDETKTVTDWKVCSTWKITFGDFEDWRKQTLLYCWMLRKLGFDACRGSIVAMMRDHSMRKAKFEPDYPKHPVHRISWTFAQEDFDKAESDLLAWFAEVRHEETVPDSHLEPCSEKQRWHKDDKWAVMKEGQKKAVRVLESEHRARSYIDYLKAKEVSEPPKRKGKYRIEYRPGEDTKCESYCSVAEFCPHYQSLMKQREQ